METGETSTVNENAPGIDPKDIEENKVWGILAYIIFFLPLITAPKSKFAKYHANQGLLLVLLSVANKIGRAHV